MAPGECGSENNQLTARQVFGDAWMDRYKRGRRPGVRRGGDTHAP